MTKRRWTSLTICLVLAVVGGYWFGKSYSASHFVHAEPVGVPEETPDEGWRRLGVGVFSSNGVNTVVWYGDAGTHYRVDRTVDLQNWDIVEAVFPMTDHPGGRIFCEDPVNGSERVYYRVKKIPAHQVESLLAER